MPRPPRNIVPRRVYHLIARFVDREWFISSALERQYYLKLLGRAISDSDWRCFAYAVMSNHIHLLVLAGRDLLGWWTRRVHSPFADALNRAHERIGSVFTRGPKAYLVPRGKFAAVMAYIHNNPVRAEVVSQPRYSDWTSHRAYIGATEAPRWLDVEDGLVRAGVAARDFDALVRARHVPSTKSEWELFDELELEEALEPAEPIVTVAPDQLVRTVAEVVGLSVEAIRSRRKTPDHVLARNAVALCGDRFGLSGTAIAQSLSLSQQAVSKILTQRPLRDPSDVVSLVVQRFRKAG